MIADETAGINRYGQANCAAALPGFVGESTRRGLYAQFLPHLKPHFRFSSKWRAIRRLYFHLDELGLSDGYFDMVGRKHPQFQGGPERL